MYLVTISKCPIYNNLAEPDLTNFCRAQRFTILIVKQYKVNPYTKLIQKKENLICVVLMVEALVSQHIKFSELKRTFLVVHSPKVSCISHWKQQLITLGHITKLNRFCNWNRKLLLIYGVFILRVRFYFVSRTQNITSCVYNTSVVKYSFFCELLIREAQSIPLKSENKILGILSECMRRQRLAPFESVLVDNIYSVYISHKFTGTAMILCSLWDFFLGLERQITLFVQNVF